LQFVSGESPALGELEAEGGRVVRTTAARGEDQGLALDLEDGDHALVDAALLSRRCLPDRCLKLLRLRARRQRDGRLKPEIRVPVKMEGIAGDPDRIPFLGGGPLTTIPDQVPWSACSAVGGPGRRAHPA